MHLKKVKVKRFTLPVVFFLTLSILASASWALRFTVYSDTHYANATHMGILDAISLEDPELMLHCGDFADEGWDPVKAQLEVHANISALLYSQKYLIAHGNHDDPAPYVETLVPPVVLNNSPQYSFVIDNILFIAATETTWANLDEDYLISQLQAYEADPTIDWRLVYFHKPPVYCSGEGRESSGDAMVEAICDQYGIDIMFYGHNHLYERSYLIYNQAAVDLENGTDNVIPPDKQGTLYMQVAQAGGYDRDITASGPGWWDAECIAYQDGYLLLNINGKHLDMEFRTPARDVLDTLAWDKDTTPVVEENRLELRPGVSTAFPNPAARGAYLCCDLLNTRRSDIEIYDGNGRRVRSLQPSGMHIGGKTKETWWDGRDDGGHSLPSGTYIYGIRHDGQGMAGMRKVVLLK